MTVDKIDQNDLERMRNHPITFCRAMGVRLFPGQEAILREMQIKLVSKDA